MLIVHQGNTTAEDALVVIQVNGTVVASGDQ